MHKISLKQIEAASTNTNWQGGQTYYKSGKVGPIKVIGAGQVATTVEGYDGYRVYMEIKEDRTRAYCSCTDSSTRGYCKHQIALAFSYAENLKDIISGRADTKTKKHPIKDAILKYFYSSNE